VVRPSWNSNAGFFNLTSRLHSIGVLALLVTATVFYFLPTKGFAPQLQNPATPRTNGLLSSINHRPL
jgi:hypothetical protein